MAVDLCSFLALKGSQGCLESEEASFLECWGLCFLLCPPPPKNLPANSGDMGSIPDLGRSHMQQSSRAHVPQLLSLCSRAWEPQLLSLCVATEAHVP